MEPDRLIFSLRPRSQLRTVSLFSRLPEFVSVRVDGGRSRRRALIEENDVKENAGESEDEESEVEDMDDLRMSDYDEDSDSDVDNIVPRQNLMDDEPPVKKRKTGVSLRPSIRGIKC